MTACRNKASRAVTAALVGVLSVGAVPMVAMAAGVNDGASLMFADPEGAFSNAKVTAAEFHHNNSDRGFSLVDGIYTTTFDENQPVTLSWFTFSMYGTGGLGDMRIEAEDPTDDFEVEYFNRGADGKTTGEEITGDISEVGKYVVVVTAVDGQYKGGKLYIPFDITARKIQQVRIVGADEVTYNAESHDFQFQFLDEWGHWINVMEGTDYTVEYIYTGHDATDKNVADVKNEGTYKAKISGMNRWDGTLTLSDTITVNPLDLASTDGSVRVEGVISASETEPENTFAIWIDGKLYSGDDAIMKELKADQSDTERVWFENGSYGYTLKAAVETPNIVNDTVFEARKVAQEIDFLYDGEALPESHDVIGSDASTSLNLNKVTGYAADGTVDGATVPNSDIYWFVYDENGKIAYESTTGRDYTVAGWQHTSGSYTVIFTCDGSGSGYKLGGRAIMYVNVYDDAVNADANAAVLYDVNGDGTKEVVTSVDGVYDGSDFTKKIDVAVRYSNGAPVPRDQYQVKYYRADGTEVKQVVDAGTYTLKLTSSSVKLSGTTEMTITVAPKSLETIRSGAVRTKSFDHAGVSTVEYLPWKENGYGVTKAGKIDGLGLQYKDGDSWVDMNPQIIQNVLKVTILRDGAEVEKITDEGVYTVHFEARNEDAANNYVVPADLTLTCVKDSHLLYADVTYTDYFADAVAAVNDLGVMSGYTDAQGNAYGVFGATDSLTRGQVATILYRLANGEGLVETEPVYNEIFGYETGFEDCNGKAFYAQAVAWAKSVGVVEGYADGTFRPEQAVTRQEFATMLKNYEQLFGDYSAADESVLDKFSDASE
ncbi:hypothetical protein B5F79_10715, partial [Olsenella sp. An285]|uniref:S-layer homology domain-containing protein n=1 Tax=Olsenella sp. An285 TaxID=1965621 RepID=UPI000B5504F7